MRIGGFVCSSMILAAAIAQGVPSRQIVAVRVDSAIRPDGDCAEQAYGNAVWSDPFVVLDPESRQVNGLYLAADRKYADLKTRVAAFYDDLNFYVCIEAPLPKGVRATKRDRVEVHLSPSGDAVYQVSVDSEGLVRSVRYDSDPRKAKDWESGAKAGTHVSSSEYVVELAIPFKSLGVKGLPVDMKANFVRRGESTGGFSSWAPTNRELVQRDLFGDVRCGPGEGTDNRTNDPLPENDGKAAFLWGDDPWANSGQFADVPLNRPELVKLRLVGPRGARAVAAFRVSNLTERHSLYNIYVESDDPQVARRFRVRELGYLELRGGEVVPDPIFEQPIGSVLRIAPKSTAVVWVDADFSGLASGGYDARLRFVPGYSNDAEKTLPVAVTVGKADVSEIGMRVHYYHQDSNPVTARLAKEYGINVVVLNIATFPLRADGKTPDYTEMDGKVDAFLSAGIARDELGVRIDLQLPGYADSGFTAEQKRRLRFMNPEWKTLYAERIRGAVAHLKDKYGIGYDRIELKVQDEPRGDPDDPKSKAYAALKAAEYLRTVDPNLRLGCNPLENRPKQISRYVKSFDMLEPYIRGLMDGTEDGGMAESYRMSGREVSSYAIYVKQNTVRQYRRGFWSNMNYGFSGYFAVYGLIVASGDPFNSYDYRSPGSNCRSDWNSAYFNGRTGQITPSRRMEAWYQGLVDMKLFKWCCKRIAERKNRGADMTGVESELSALLKAADTPLGDLALARAKLMSIAEGL